MYDGSTGKRVSGQHYPISTSKVTEFNWMRGDHHTRIPGGDKDADYTDAYIMGKQLIMCPI